MRVLVVHSTYLSGSASGENRVVEDEVALLREGGHDVFVWRPEPSGDTLRKRATLGVRAIHSPAATAMTRAYVEKHSIDIVHVHNPFPMLSPSVITAASKSGAGVVWTLHNFRLTCVAGTFLRDGVVCEDCLGKSLWPGAIHRCYKQSLAGSVSLVGSLSVHRSLGTFDDVDAFVAVSDFVRVKHIQGGMEPERIHVKPNFAWPAVPRVGSGDYFLYLGRLSREKGISTLVEGWRKSRSSESLKLLIAGDGPDKSLVTVKDASIRYLGQLPADDVVAHLRSARALIVPSICYEAGPRTISEAFASGVPVITSDLGALPEHVAHDHSGLLFPANDSDALARAIDRLAADRESRRMGANAYDEWHRRFSPTSNLERLEELYEQARGAKGRSFSRMRGRAS